MILTKSVPPKQFDFRWVLFQSAWPWLKLNCQTVDTQNILSEAKSLASHFEPYSDQLSSGWSLLNLGGPLELWNTEAIEVAPQIQTFNPILRTTSPIKNFLENFTLAPIKAAQVLCLKPGGFVSWHSDKQLRQLDRLVFPINNPDGAEVEFENWGYAPYTQGDFFLIDTSWKHRAFNNSSQNRYHLQLSFDMSAIPDKFKVLVKKSVAS